MRSRASPWTVESRGDCSGGFQPTWANESQLEVRKPPKLLKLKEFPNHPRGFGSRRSSVRVRPPRPRKRPRFLANSDRTLEAESGLGGPVGGISRLGSSPPASTSRAYHKARGARDRLLAQLMGHRDPRSVEKYAKLDGSAIRAGLERLRKRRRGE